MKSNQPTAEEIVKIFQVGISTIQTAMEFYRDSFRPDTYDRITTPLFWDCKCEKDYIQAKSLSKCSCCGAFRDNQSDARVEEVLHAALEWKKRPNRVYYWSKDDECEERPGGEDE